MKQVNQPAGKLPRVSILGNMATKKSSLEDSSKNNWGVSFTGYVEKRNPVFGTYKKRFMVLTLEAVHWFKREENDDLFGEQRGVLGLGNLLNVSTIDEDATVFMLESTDTKKRLFRCSNPDKRDEWVSAIQSAYKNFTTLQVKKHRRVSLSNMRAINMEELADDEQKNLTEVDVLLVSLKTENTEVVIARTPSWDRIINISNVKDGDVLIICTNNGGTINITSNVLFSKAFEGVDFDMALQNVALASSLSLTILDDGLERNSKIFKSKPGSNNETNESFIEKWEKILITIFTDRTNSISIVLSSMVILVGISSMKYLGPDTSLLFIFASSLAVYNIYWIINKLTEGKDKPGRDLSLIVHGHSFTSPDAPINEENDEIPIRFIDGCEQDMVEARRRWDITRHWRETEGLNGLLEEPQPHYFTIKSLYPHYHAGRGKLGHVVYYERPGDLDHAQLAARGINVEEMLRHWLFLTEYQWEVMYKHDQAGKSLSIIDVENVKMFDLAGDNLNFVKKSISIANCHYPERSFVIYIINAPQWFSMFWKIIKPMIHSNTQKKVRILSKKETLEGLQEHIHISQIDSYYGGELDFGGKDTCRVSNYDQLALNEFVHNLNNQNNTKTPYDDIDNSPNEKPPGQPGDSRDNESNVAELLAPKINSSLSLSTDENLITPVKNYNNINSTLTPESQLSPITMTPNSINNDTTNNDSWSLSSSGTNNLTPLGIKKEHNINSDDDNNYNQTNNTLFTYANPWRYTLRYTEANYPEPVLYWPVKKDRSTSSEDTHTPSRPNSMRLSSPPINHSNTL